MSEPAKRLAALEAVIARGLRTYVEVGTALSEIRDARLYREQGYDDFGAYCRERWDISKTYASRQITAGKVAEELPIGTKLPANEAQARELARIDDPQVRAEVWGEAVAEAEAEEKEPTAESLGTRVAVRLRIPADTAARAAERKRQRLAERAEYAIRTGNYDLPPEPSISPGAWDQAVWDAVRTRKDNIPNVVDALSHELQILRRHADPEAVGRYLAEPRDDPDEAERYALVFEDLREGAAWLRRVIEEAERRRGG